MTKKRSSDILLDDLIEGADRSGFTIDYLARGDARPLVSGEEEADRQPNGPARGHEGDRQRPCAPSVRRREARRGEGRDGGAGQAAAEPLQVATAGEYGGGVCVMHTSFRLLRSPWPYSGCSRQSGWRRQ